MYVVSAVGTVVYRLFIYWWSAVFGVDIGLTAHPGPPQLKRLAARADFSQKDFSIYTFNKKITPYAKKQHHEMQYTLRVYHQNFTRRRKIEISL